jgi:hypothetical protein
MRKNTTTLATLALSLLDSMINATEQTSAPKATDAPTIPVSPITHGVSRASFGEEDVVSFLVDEVGMELKTSIADYPPTAKMMSMSTDEVRQIMAYCDELKAKAEFGDKVMKSVDMLKGLFR